MTIWPDRDRKSAAVELRRLAALRAATASRRLTVEVTLVEDARRSAATVRISDALIALGDVEALEIDHYDDAA
jgi:hypothetical protein